MIQAGQLLKQDVHQRQFVIVQLVQGPTHHCFEFFIALDSVAGVVPKSGFGVGIRALTLERQAASFV